MASEPNGDPSADDTRVIDADDAPGAEEVTQADGDWPVTDLYYVEPSDDSNAAATSGNAPATRPDEAVVVTAPAGASADRQRRIPRDVGPGVLLAILGTVAALALGAVLLSMNEESPAPTQAVTEGTSTDSTETSPSSPPPTATVAVQDVEGSPLPEARATLLEQGFRVRVRRSPSDRPPGEVLEQAPEAGSEVPRRTVVALVVSAREPTPQATAVQVPNVVGLSASRASSEIRAAGLEPRIQVVSSASGRSGTVVHQTPGGGSDVAEGETVRLEVVRARPAVQRVEVPDVVGSTVTAARRELRAVGLASTVVKAPSDQPTGTVIRQSPRAGVERAEGSTVTLTVSSGPAMVDVPDVTGLEEAAARLELEQAGFQVRVTDESTDDPAQDGIVLQQTPLGGSTAAKGSLVTLTVARFD